MISKSRRASISKREAKFQKERAMIEAAYTLPERLLITDSADSSFSFYDRVNPKGSVRPGLNPTGRSKPLWEVGHGWVHLNADHTWESKEALHRAFASALAMAARNRHNKIPQVDPGNGYRVMGSVAKSFILHPEEARAWGYEVSDNPYLPCKLYGASEPRYRKGLMGDAPVFALPHLPKRSVLGMGLADVCGLYARPVFKEDYFRGVRKVFRGDFTINPDYVVGFIRKGPLK